MKKQNIVLILVLGILSVVVWGVWDTLYAEQNKNSIPVESINLKISKAELREGDSWVTVNNILSVEQPSATFLRVELGVTELVSDPARKFEEIRFVLGEGSTIKVDGTSYPLTVPSGQTSGLKIKTAFSIEANIIAVIFDVQDNLAYNQGNGYSLKPVVQEAIVEQVYFDTSSFNERIKAVAIFPHSAEIGVKTTARLTVTMKSAENLIKESVYLYKCDIDGRPTFRFGRLFDDGTHGDFEADNNLYTIEFQLNEPEAKTIYFMVIADQKDGQRIKSNIMDFNIVVPKTGLTLNDTIKDSSPEIKEAVTQAHNYLENAKYILPEERENTLLDIPNITKVSCDISYCSYEFSDGSTMNYFYSFND